LAAPAISYLLDRAVDHTLDYQRYYLMGFDGVARLRVADEPLVSRLFPPAERKVTAIRLRSRVRAKLFPETVRRDSGHVGRYVAELGDREVRFVIDAHDAAPIRSPELLEWSDVFFKANAWPTVEYDPRVLPIVNGNGDLSKRQIRYLRGLREREKDLDVVFISRVWGGREHNVFLFEELARLPLRSRLLAVFPPGFTAEEDERDMARLRRAGVELTTKTISHRELWDTLARARVVLLRAGRHLCIPWRTVDLLCMGACIALDAPFAPQWPVPLRDGVNFVDCGIPRGLDTSAAEPAEYARLGETIQQLLLDEEKARSIRIENARYFDEHAAPARVAEYVLRTLAAAGAAGPLR
jgi:hypothetical protein